MPILPRVFLAEACLGIVVALYSIGLQIRWGHFFYTTGSLAIIILFYCSAEVLLFLNKKHAMLKPSAGILIVSLLLFAVCLMLPSDMQAFRKSSDTTILPELRYKLDNHE